MMCGFSKARSCHIYRRVAILSTFVIISLGAIAIFGLGSGSQYRPVPVSTKGWKLQKATKAEYVQKDNSPDTEEGRSKQNYPPTVRNSNIGKAETRAVFAEMLPDIHDKRLTQILKKYDRQFNNINLLRYPKSHGIVYTDNTGNTSANGRHLRCRFKAGHKMDILDKDTSPYKEMGLARYFPDDNGLVKFEETFKSCAVVGSSSYMNDSSLGSEIDSHEAVLRFNMAPTEGFEKDVGTKTTIRLINGQVLEEKNANKFANIVNNETLFLWKAGPYNGNLVRWYADKKVRSFFVDYVYWRDEHAQKVPYIMHPSSLWSAWDLIQEHTNNTIKTEVPTSGFTGVLIMLRLCQKVDIYGYLTPDNSSCHYFPMDRPCAPLSWHPVSSERDVLKRMSEGVVQDPLASHKGLVTLTGFPATLC